MYKGLLLFVKGSNPVWKCHWFQFWKKKNREKSNNYRIKIIKHAFLPGIETLPLKTFFYVIPSRTNSHELPTSPSNKIQQDTTTSITLLSSGKNQMIRSNFWEGRMDFIYELFYKTIVSEREISFEFERDTSCEIIHTHPLFLLYKNSVREEVKYQLKEL